MRGSATPYSVLFGMFHSVFPSRSGGDQPPSQCMIARRWGFASAHADIFERGLEKWRWCGVSVVGTLDRSDDGKRVVSPLWERRGSSIPIESRENQSKVMKKLCQLGLSGPPHTRP